MDDFVASVLPKAHLTMPSSFLTLVHPAREPRPAMGRR